jgi:gas vesicle protein
MDDATRRVERKRTRSEGTTAQAVEPIDPSLSKETDDRAREIRAEIAQTRDDMSETLEAIQDRLKPSTIVANATETVRNATTEKVKQMANVAGDAANQMMNNSFVDTIRANPVPTALIGLGAAWLLIKGRSPSRGNANRSYAGDEFDTERGQYDWRSKTRSQSAPRYLAAGNEATESGTSVSQIASDVSARASEYAADVKDATRRTRQRAQNTFDRVMRDSPLALGAAATIVGAAIGMSLPSTEAENQWLGEARDTVVEQVKGVANQAVDQVKEAASRAADTAKPQTAIP